MKTYIQSGHNDKYPRRIETWIFGQQPPPEWISDVCKVKFIDALGNISLEYRETSTGGLEIINASGDKVALKIPSRTDYVCYGDGRIFTLRPIQLELLYTEEKRRGRT